MIVVPMLKGNRGSTHTTWHFDPRVLTAIGLGASGTQVQYVNEYPHIPALICGVSPNGLIASDFISIITTASAIDSEPYMFRPFGIHADKLKMSEFIKEVENGCLSDGDGFFYYASNEAETTLNVDFQNINKAWPFVIMYKKV